MQDKNIRMRLLAVQKIVLNRSASNPISVKEIIERINAMYHLMIPVSDRRAIYSDIKALVDAGYSIKKASQKNNQFVYWCD